MADLGGARVGLLEGRMSGEMAGLVRRHGGVPVSAPAVREAPVECAELVAAFTDRLGRGEYDLVVFQTGAGVNALFGEAERLGRLPELLEGLRGVKVACRGPKPSAPLRRHGVPISVAAREPYTTPELLEAMAGLELAGTRAAVLHYGERNTELSAALADRGARVDDLCVYEWLLPEDTTELRGLVQVILEGGVDAVAFTSQIQARHLFAVAGEVGLAEELTDALNTGVVTASVAPTCLAVLEGLGVRPHVVPRHAKMGHLVVALAEHIERGGSRGSIPTAEDAPP